MPSDPVPNQFWTLFDKSTSEIIKEHQATPGTADESLPVGLASHLAWLVESSDSEPTFNANTHRLEPSESITIDSNDPRTGTRVFTNTVEPLSDEQLADKAIQAKRKRNAHRVREAARKFKDGELVTQVEVHTLLEELVLRDRMDIEL